MLNLFDYQEKCLKGVENALSEGKNPLICFATGLGKTGVMVKAAEGFQRDNPGKDVLFLVHRRILAGQAAESFKKFCDITVDVDSSLVDNDFAVDKNSHFKVTTVQKLISDLKNGKDYSNIGCVITDEAHHYCAPAYNKALRDLGVGNGTRLIGATATPSITSSSELAQLFDRCVGNIDIFRGSIMNRLAKVIDIRSDVEVDLKGFDVVSGDYKDDDIANALYRNIDKLADEVAKNIECNDRQSIIFCPTIAFARDFTAALEKRGIDIKCVDSKMVDDACTGRSAVETLEDFKAKKFKVLCNVGMATEGFDCRDISLMVNLRPTTSKVVMAQEIGRATRISPGKDYCRVLDFNWKTDKRNVVDCYDILCPTANMADRARKLAVKQGNVRDAILCTARVRISMYAYSQLLEGKPLDKPYYAKAVLENPVTVDEFISMARKSRLFRKDDVLRQMIADEKRGFKTIDLRKMSCTEKVLHGYAGGASFADIRFQDKLISFDEAAKLSGRYALDFHAGMTTHKKEIIDYIMEKSGAEKRLEKAVLQKISVRKNINKNVISKNVTKSKNTKKRSIKKSEEWKSEERKSEWWDR